MWGLEDKVETVRTSPMSLLSRGASRVTGDKSMLAVEGAAASMEEEEMLEKSDGIESSN